MSGEGKAGGLRRAEGQRARHVRHPAATTAGTGHQGGLWPCHHPAALPSTRQPQRRAGPPEIRPSTDGGLDTWASGPLPVPAAHRAQLLTPKDCGLLPGDGLGWAEVSGDHTALPGGQQHARHTDPQMGPLRKEHPALLRLGDRLQGGAGTLRICSLVTSPPPPISAFPVSSRHPAGGRAQSRDGRPPARLTEGRTEGAPTARAIRPALEPRSRLTISARAEMTFPSVVRDLLMLAPSCVRRTRLKSWEPRLQLDPVEPAPVACMGGAAQPGLWVRTLGAQEALRGWSEAPWPGGNFAQHFSLAPSES